jgi:pimeloyl-ACP methyl ester carboxylesterase
MRCFGVTVERDRVTANGIEFEYFHAGEGRLALCLHGFPDDAGSMRPLLTRLADAEFHAVAPYMRGYGPTRTPNDDYSTVTLGQDAIALADALDSNDSSNPPVLIGHDWGAAASYAAAAIDPTSFGSIVTMALPPRFESVIFDHPKQFLRSWYIGLFQLPHAERALEMADFALIEFLWNTWSPGWDYSTERIEAVKDTFRTPGTVEASLAYYRQFGRQLALSKLDEGRSDPSSPLDIDALVIAGARDGCIGPELFEQADEAFAGDCRVVQISDAGHFMHQERPDVVANEIREWIAKDN